MKQEGERTRAAVPVLAALGLVLIMVLVTPYMVVGVEPEAEVGCTPVSSGLFAVAYGGTDSDGAGAVLQTPDGGYVVAGSTSSFSASPPDAWVVKLNRYGGMAWDRVYAGPAYDSVGDIQQTAASGYVAAGFLQSSASGIDRDEARVVRLDGDGNLEWDYIYVGTDSGKAYDVEPLVGDGYVVAAVAHEGGTYAQVDPWVIKLKDDGKVSWERVYYATGFDLIEAIQPSAGGGYIVAGQTDSFGAGFSDAWVLKLDGNGGLAWQKTYGGTSLDAAYDIQRTEGAGYIMVGRTHSYGAGQGDAWVLNLNGDGSVAWQKTYGGPYKDLAMAVQQTTDGGYILAGETETEDPPFGEGPHDAWLLKLNGDGSVAWSKTYGTAESDGVSSVQQTSDGGYVVGGATYSYGAGDKDVWVLRVDPEGNLCPGCPLGQTFAVTVTDSTATPATSTATVKLNAAKAANSNPAVNDTGANPDYACACGLSICKGVIPESNVAHHGTVTYTIVLSNDMAVDATEVWLADLLPGEVSPGAWLEQPPGAQFVDQELFWSGTVPAGQMIAFSFAADHVGNHGDVVTNRAEFSQATATGSAAATFVVVDEPPERFRVYLPLMLKER